MAATEIRLSEKAISAVKKSLSAKNRLQYELNCSFLTIMRWLKKNDSKLTTAQSLRIISEETGLTIDDLLEENVRQTA